jgi:hypothetical protein
MDFNLHILLLSGYSGQNIGIFIISANSGDRLSINNPLGAHEFHSKSDKL